ncbi:MAG: hypothetical protein J0L52_07445 [Caulobacterales bacterium]|nr:hypothetical protein [Caulobacterales bacterium]
MTANEMKASLRRIKPGACLVAALVLAGATSGCMAYDPFDRTIDPTSPAAQRVEALTQSDMAYPRWADFPPAPQNVPTETDIRNQVLGLESSELRLNREVAAIVWTLTPADGGPWAERTRNRVDVRLARPARPDEAAEAVAWAQRMRQRAEPPPPIDH